METTDERRVLLLSAHQLEAESSMSSTSEAGSASGGSGGSNNSERRPSPAMVQNAIQQPSVDNSLLVKPAKSVLFDTRSTTHAHSKRVQSGNNQQQNSQLPLMHVQCQSFFPFISSCFSSLIVNANFYLSWLVQYCSSSTNNN